MKILRLLDFRHYFIQDRVDVLQEQIASSSVGFTQQRFVSCSLYVSSKSWWWWWCTPYSHSGTQADGSSLLIAVISASRVPFG